MNKNVLVLLNENHRLLKDQERLINEKFGSDWAIFPVPADGWTLEEQTLIAAEICERPVVVASPVPVLLARLAAIKAARAQRDLFNIKVNLWVFHNDKRVAKEIPDGKGGLRVIHTVAPDGWLLAEI